MSTANHRCALALLAASLLILICSTVCAGQEQTVEAIGVKSAIREIGYSVGDIARQTIVVDTPPGYRFDPSSLPSLGKSSASIELRDAQWQFQDMRDMTRHTLVLEWQVFQVLQEIRSYQLNPQDLLFRLDGSVIHARPDSGQVIVSSLLPSRLSAENVELLPDAKPLPRQTRNLEWGLLVAVLILILSIGYFAWYLDWLKLGSASSRPFRMACREMRAIRKTRDSHSEQLRASMRILRRASDTSAGIALSKERLHLLFDRNPWLLPLRAEIEKLYADSERLFFAGATETIDLKHLYKLGKKLRALES
ncbi:MAG: hypothetical protein CVU35_00775 [Betaproteobacteria bacterium HGW-Betaproteobacteria-8]|nr:MAG: hypothetical protein CVU35_00775 [Betaproteobacteria bacterium HGW-Betaproteobacteria-8]